MTYSTDKIRLLLTASVFAVWTLWTVLLATGILGLVVAHVLNSGGLSGALAGVLALALLAVPFGVMLGLCIGIAAAVVCLPAALAALGYAERRCITEPTYFVASGGLSGLVTGVAIAGLALVAMQLGGLRLDGAWMPALLVIMTIGGALTGAWYQRMTPNLEPIPA